MDPLFLQLTAPAILEHITYILNLSILTCRIPSIWKTAHIPMSKLYVDLYPNISKLLCLAKILETLVNDQLK